MNTDYYLAWLIPIAPLVAAIVAGFAAFCNRGQTWAHLPTWAGIFVSACATTLVTMRVDANGLGTIYSGYDWLDIGRVTVAIALQMDSICLTELLVVTWVSLLVAIYARGYMHDDPGYARFFAIFAGFVFSMVMLVAASNLLVMYMFWECVGLCSYLMVGFWFERPAASRAATKAFLVNRVADTAFMIGILLLWYGIGTVSTSDEVGWVARLDFSVIFKAVPDLAQQNPALLTAVALCVLIGGVGKSAQFPLHVWLPDAMEGPTPVSALIHAATMVTAGVYLLCRMSPLFVEAPDVLVITGWLGGVSALGAAIIACFQSDLKRVLAYSTISQLGYTFMALSCGSDRDLMSVSIQAAMFHLATHAFFKSLLFLTAGNVMHALSDIIDMRQFSGLRVALPVTHMLFAIGAAALAGFPLLSGFWSKDSILLLLTTASKQGSNAGLYSLLLWIGYLTAFLTAFYIFRAYYFTFQGVLRVPAKCVGKVHDMPASMNWPLFVLAVGAIFLGMTLAFSGALNRYTQQQAFLSEPIEIGHAASVPLISVVACLLGALFAYLIARRVRQSNTTNRNVGFWSEFIGNGFYVDQLYATTIVRPVTWIAFLLDMLDKLGLAQAIKQFAAMPEQVGRGLRKSQTGRFTQYAMWTVMGMLLIFAMTIWGKV